MFGEPSTLTIILSLSIVPIIILILYILKKRK